MKNLVLGCIILAVSALVTSILAFNKDDYHEHSPMERHVKAHYHSLHSQIYSLQKSVDVIAKGYRDDAERHLENCEYAVARLKYLQAYDINKDGKDKAMANAILSLPWDHECK